MKTRKANHSHTYIFSMLLLVSAMLLSACAQRRIESRSISPPPPLSENAININTASREELAKTPYIGEASAARIVEYREKYGPFRRPEHLMLVDGIGEKKYRLIRSLIRTE